MAEEALENLKQAEIELPRDDQGEVKPIPNTLDNGYYSLANVEGLENLGMDPHIATGRQKHHQAPVATTTGEAPRSATVKEKMAHKLKTAAGRALYAARKAIVEPVFGQI